MTTAALESMQMRLDQLLPDREAAAARRFAERLLEHAPAALVADVGAEGLPGLVLSTLKCVSRRRPGEVLVKLLNPEPTRDGWGGGFTAAVINLDDRPFIVASVQAELRRHGLCPRHVLHPILTLRRRPDGQLELTDTDSHKPRREACEVYLLERIDDPSRVARVEEGVRRVLADVVRVTDDHEAMRQATWRLRNALERAATQLSERSSATELVESNGADLPPATRLREEGAFLDWLSRDHFIFLGYREERTQAEGKREPILASGLGLLRPDHPAPALPLDEGPDRGPEEQAGSSLHVARVDAVSNVHRDAHMDCIRVRLPAGRGAEERQAVLLGLFTSQAQSAPVRDIPVLGTRLSQVLHLDGTLPDSHDATRISALFNSMPREELLCSSPSQLRNTIRLLMEMGDSRMVRLAIRPVNGGMVAALVMPRERYRDEVRDRIIRHLHWRLGARYVDILPTSLDDTEPQARLQVFVATDKPLADVGMDALEREVAKLSRSWADHVEELLVARHGHSHAGALTERYLPLLSEAYRTATSPEAAATDLENLEALQGQEVRVDVTCATGSAAIGSSTSLVVYHRRLDLVLNETLPVFECLGLRVLGQNFYTVPSPGASAETPPFRIDVFEVQMADGGPVDVKSHRDLLVAAVQDVLEDRAESDPLNGLVLSASLSVRQVSLLRAYRNYLAQLDPVPARKHANSALLADPRTSRTLFDFFEARFRPDVSQRETKTAEVRQRFVEGLARVTSLAHDRVLRSLLNLMEATVRTNFFLERPSLAFKIDSRAVESMPEPRPLFEIFVDAPGVQGIHLRGGRIARGGLRWSDRPDDFRTEVLGLIRTQMTKNTLIVPVGSKGGFVLKRPPTERASLQAHARENYAVFVRALLDLTDNVVDGRVVSPAGIVVHDSPDPYLVVAADKGTATFSDIANSVAAACGFWLGDAFASGGSHGYDHKKEGITARGAWESVRQHFREIGLHPHREPFTVVGIGDMAGDVFGNGMLCSSEMRLLAAFNHQHVFIDPDPPPARSFAERQRLFALPRSSWSDYDPSVISPGGGVYERNAKVVPLSETAKSLLGLETDSPSGEDVIRAILALPVDLLWNGGIGTYVKASGERHDEVGDPANDGVRIDANRLRARVVGEGGNQGFTQRARVEYARGGGRINTDAVDNSGGVDLSDHEVNLKILLQPLVARESISPDERNRLLGEMKQEAIELVLRDNRRHSLCLALEEQRSRRSLSPYEACLELLTRKGLLDRELERLPDARNLRERMNAGEGLTRPELAVLLAYTKMALFEQLLASDLPDAPSLEHYLLHYFPEVARQVYPEAVRGHQLRREIAATQMCNRLADFLGLAFLHELETQAAAEPIEVLHAVLAAIEIVDAGPVFLSLFNLQGLVAHRPHLEMVEKVVSALREVSLGILHGDSGSASLSDLVSRYRAPLRAFQAAPESLLTSSDLARFRQSLAEHRQAGVPAELIPTLAWMEFAPAAMSAVDVARRSGLEAPRATRLFHAVGTRLSIRWLEERLARLDVGDRWEKVSLSAIGVDLRRAQVRLAVLASRTVPDGSSESSLSVGNVLQEHAPLLARYDRLLDEVQRSGVLTLASATVLSRLLLALVEAAA